MTTCMRKEVNGEYMVLLTLGKLLKIPDPSAMPWDLEVTLSAIPGK